MNTEDTVRAAGQPRTAKNARVALIVGAVVLAAFVVGSVLADLGWLSWLLARIWLLVLVVLAVALIAAYLFDLSRPKNIAWRRLVDRFGTKFDAELDRKTFGTGRGQIGDNSYFGVRTFGSPEGLEIGRIVTTLNPPIYIPWSAIAKVDAFPNLLTGRRGFETDMQAQINLRDDPDLAIEIPWLKEYRQLLPKSVKYRSIKLSKK